MTVDERRGTVIDWPDDHELSAEGRDRLDELERDLVSRVSMVRIRRRRRSASLALLLLGTTVGSWILIDRDGSNGGAIDRVAAQDPIEDERRVNDAGSDSSARDTEPGPRIRIVRSSAGSASSSSLFRSISDEELKDILIEAGTAAVLSCGDEVVDRPCTLSLIGTGQS